MAGSAICRSLISGYCDHINNGSLLTPNRKELNLLDKEDVMKWFKANNPSTY